jgi:hypothetical protein
MQAEVPGGRCPPTPPGRGESPCTRDTWGLAPHPNRRNGRALPDRSG